MAKISILLFLTVAFVSCKGSKSQTEVLVLGKWKCITHLRFDDQGILKYKQPLPCVYDLMVTKDELALLDGHGDHGGWPYSIKDNTIFMGLDFGEAFKIKKVSPDTMILVRIGMFSDYKKALTQMTFVR